MARRRIRLAWIENRAARKATLKKRRPSLLKKVSELAILCDVPAAIIINSPDEQEAALWPAQREVVQQVLSGFLDLPEINQSKKSLNQETYLMEEVDKLGKKVLTVEKKLMELELETLINQTDQDREVGLLNLSQQNAHNLAIFTKDKIREIRSKIGASSSGLNIDDTQHNIQYSSPPTNTNEGGDEFVRSTMLIGGELHCVLNHVNAGVTVVPRVYIVYRIYIVYGL
ncbi:agamous-like MADS-box protein AGL29 [Tripterygium wilfordii]|uniref:agamous-like MADS-box protein AGL29 n=1 Tax=Tripterygium wilfordii TaxID=458696 RepID=UPI0018F82125|nr:agamous-like MADS-box protein AGL29 [Tripterygium wilfordii]